MIAVRVFGSIFGGRVGRRVMSGAGMSRAVLIALWSGLDRHVIGVAGLSGTHSHGRKCRPRTIQQERGDQHEPQQ